MSLKRLIRIIYLTLAVLLGTTGTSWGADYNKGMEAYQSDDFATALREWKPLAEFGLPNAQFNLGWMYHKGQGVLQDYKTAVKWYTLAAEQGDADAQFNLGLMYYYGQGVPQDYEIALKWYTLATETPGEGEVRTRDAIWPWRSATNA